jgi:hypothetical protein
VVRDHQTISLPKLVLCLLPPSTAGYTGVLTVPYGALCALLSLMDTHEQWPRHEEDTSDSPVHVLPAINGSSSTRRNSTAQIPGYTLMVAGQRSGKTSFLRLLLDTSNFAPTVSKEQVTSVARFVQGCSRHTTNIRHTSVDVLLDSTESGVPHPVTLTLIDTPSLNFSDEAASQRAISDILAHVDSRFAESIEKASVGLRAPHSILILQCSGIEWKSPCTPV